MKDINPWWFLIFACFLLGIVYGAVKSCLIIANGGSLFWLFLAIPCSLLLGLGTIAVAESDLKERAKTHEHHPNNEVKE